MQIRKALPFGDCYKKFGEAVETLNLELPAGRYYCCWLVGKSRLIA